MNDGWRHLTAYFAARQWPSSIAEKDKVVVLQHDWSVPPFTSRAYLFGTGPRVVYDSRCPQEVAAEHRASVSQFLTLINFELMVTAFAMEWETGVIRCRSAVDLQGQALTDATLDGVVIPNHEAMIRWLPHLLSVVRGDQTADEAFTEAIEQLG